MTKEAIRHPLDILKREHQSSEQIAVLQRADHCCAAPRREDERNGGEKDEEEHGDCDEIGLNVIGR
jgi:hypothetical protein